MQHDYIKIDLIGPDGELHPDGYFNLFLHLYFPNCADERSLALEIFRFERARFERLKGDFALTNITKAIIEKVNKQVSQRHVAGLVALAMVGETLTNGTCSLNKAAEITSEYCLTYPKQKYWNLFAPDLATTEANLRTDPSSIKTAFRTHRRSAHICAAQVVAAEYSQPKIVFERAFEYEATFIQTCAFFQSLLARQPLAEGWGLFDVVGTRPESIAAYPFLTPSDDAHIQFFGPYWHKRPPEGS